MNHHSLSELNELIKTTLEKELSPSYWVIAEIGEIKVNQKGHCYLELIEKEGERLCAKLRATIWSYTYRNLSVWFEGITGQALKEGMKIRCSLTVQFHELYGLSANIRDIDAHFTLGEKARKKQETLQRLMDEKVLECNKSLQLPLAPQRVAIISSPTAAGLEDFMHQLKHNSHGYVFRGCLFKAMMQGEAAQGSIIGALGRIKEQIHDFDLVAIIRGGGSQSDLDCFDAYELAKAVALFPIPIITGIGHEKDESITDKVAHTRLKTPTAVSEFLISGLHSLEERLDLLQAKVTDFTRNYLHHQGQWLENQYLRLHSGTKHLLLSQKGELGLLENRLYHSSRKYLENKLHRLEVIEKTIELADPQEILRRGYTLTTYQGKKLQENTKLSPGDKIKTEFYDKIIYSIVERKEGKESQKK